MNQFRRVNDDILDVLVSLDSTDNKVEAVSAPTGSISSMSR